MSYCKIDISTGEIIYGGSPDDALENRDTEHRNEPDTPQLQLEEVKEIRTRLEELADECNKI